MALTKEQVFEAADRLAASGAKPTLAALRAEVGGSYRTLSPALREWKAARKEAAGPQPATVPQAVAERAAAFGSQLWSLALRSAEERLAAERAAMQQAREELEEAREEAAALADRLTADLEASRKSCAQLEARASDAERALAVAQERAREARAERDAARREAVEAREVAYRREGELVAQQRQLDALLARLAPAGERPDSGR